jgi:hypothetical protein
MGLDKSCELPDQPESIWGDRHAPEENHPHHYFARGFRKAGIVDSLATRFGIADTSSIELLAEACPNSLRRS